MQENTVFSVLNALDCNEHTEKKGSLTYLSWAWAWQIVKSHYPDASYTIYENPDGWNYFTDGKTCWVKTGVTIEGLEHIEYLPVMDARNQSIPHYAVTSTDVNRTIQRSLTKACARHGLGLYIYAEEDLLDSADAEQPQRRRTQRTSQVQRPLYMPLYAATEQKQPADRPFIKANTKEVGFSHLQDDCIIPVFSRDNSAELRGWRDGAVRCASILREGAG